jgi:hypothetical protein
MSLPPDSLKAGECYLMRSGQVRRIIVLDGDRVRYEARQKHWKHWAWHPGIVPTTVLASMVERAVPLEWTPETDE